MKKSSGIDEYNFSSTNHEKKSFNLMNEQYELENFHSIESEISEFQSEDMNKMYKNIPDPDNKPKKPAFRSSNAVREYLRRCKETPEEKSARRAMNAQRARLRRAQENPEAKKDRLAREALRQKRRRENETEDERKARLVANALRQQKRRSREALKRQHDSYEAPQQYDRQSKMGHNF